MATQAIAGRRGRLTLALSSASTAVAMAEVTGYELTVEAPDADASSFDSSGWNEILPVGRAWDLGFSIVATSANFGAQENSPAGFRGFITGAVSARAKRYATLFPSTSATAKWAGAGVFSRIEIQGDVGDVMRAEFQFVGHGPLTYTT